MDGVLFVETKVKAPNGEIITVKHPEGASEDEIIAYAKANYTEEKAPEKPYTPPQGGTIFDALGQGAWLGFSDELSGALGAIPAAISTGDWDLGKHYTGIRDQARQNVDEFAERNPKTAMAAEIGGGLLTGGAGGARLVGLKGAQLVKGSGLLGAAYGGASGAGHSDEDSVGGVLTDTAIGAGMGGAAGMAFPAAGQVLSKLRQSAKPSGEYVRQVRLLQGDDIPLTGGQISGSNWQKAGETQLAQVPIGGTPLQRVMETQRKQFQRGLVKRIVGDDITEEGLITAKTLKDIGKRLGKEYDEALKGKTISLSDEAFIEDLGKIEAKHSRLVDSRTKKKIRNIVDEFLDEDANVSGEWYQEQRSLFADRSQSKSELAPLYDDLKKALDRAFERAAPKVKRDLDTRYAQFKQLDDQYRAVGGGDVAEGYLPLASLNRRAKSKPGSEEWRDYVNSGASVLIDRIPNSGTAARNYITGLLTGGAFFEPTSVAGGVLASRALAKQAAKGRLDVTKLLPSGALLSDPRLAQGVAANAGLLQ